MDTAAGPLPLRVAHGSGIKLALEHGARLAGIKAQPAGPRYAAVSDGPLLYIRLPPGRYRIGARLDGAWQARQIRIGAAARPVRIAFVTAGR